jgi:hypothetical protein
VCNPRRVQVHATRRLAEAWDQEVRRQVTLHGQAVGRAAVREQLAGTVGRPVLASLERVLEQADGWYEADGGYRHDADGGYVIYHPDTMELEIVAELSSEVQGAGEASTEVRGTVDDVLDVEGTGRYYDDGWGGFTEERARTAAEADAQRALQQAAADRIAEARSLADAGADAEVQAAAEGQAREALAASIAAREEQLRLGAADRLTTVGVQARALFNVALAQGYRDAIVAYAHSRHAEGLQMTRNGDVLTIQFEMEA